MRNVVFVNGSQLYTASPIDLAQLPENNLCLCYYDKDGVRKVFDSNASKFRHTTTFHVVVKSSVSGKPTLIDIPVDKAGLSWTKSEYRADTKFNANFTVTAPTVKGEYSLTIVKRGSINNERYKWTISVYVDKLPTNAAQLATLIAKDINAKKETLGLKAVANSATITLTCEDTTDFELIPMDNLSGIEVTYTTRGLRGQNDEEFIRELAMMHASNQGFNYTADGAELYSGYGKLDLSLISPSKQFAVYTISFVNKRAVKTHDDNIKQLLHIVCPMERTFTNALEDLLNNAN